MQDAVSESLGGRFTPPPRRALLGQGLTERHAAASAHTVTAGRTRTNVAITDCSAPFYMNGLHSGQAYPMPTHNQGVGAWDYEGPSPRCEITVRHSQLDAENEPWLQKAREHGIAALGPSINALKKSRALWPEGERLGRQGVWSASHLLRPVHTLPTAEG